MHGHGTLLQVFLFPPSLATLGVGARLSLNLAWVLYAIDVGAPLGFDIRDRGNVFAMGWTLVPFLASSMHSLLTRHEATHTALPGACGHQQAADQSQCSGRPDAAAQHGPAGQGVLPVALWSANCLPKERICCVQMATQSNKNNSVDTRTLRIQVARLCSLVSFPRHCPASSKREASSAGHRRQRQLPRSVPGVFMRALAERHKMS